MYKCIPVNHYETLTRNANLLQFWNDDLGNLAQMWANKCTWDHGFLEFGEMYPNAPFKGQVGMSKNYYPFLSNFVSLR